VDAVIDDARDAAASFAADLPNFLVQQITTRFQGSRSFSNWRLMDTVTADVASVNGKEDYRNIRVNGKPTDRPEDLAAHGREFHGARGRPDLEPARVCLRSDGGSASFALDAGGRERAADQTGLQGEDLDR
jgi:hypothetical protein